MRILQPAHPRGDFIMQAAITLLIVAFAAASSAALGQATRACGQTFC